MTRTTRATPRLAALLSVALTLAACSNQPSRRATSSSSTTSTTSHTATVAGGTASFALLPGSQLNWVFPLVGFANSTIPNILDFEYLLYRPLYWMGSPGHVGLNEAESLAEPASFTTRDGKTTATITLKKYRWSDGVPVTTRDITFWINLLRAERTQWWDYVPGHFPDNIAALDILSARRFSITFDSTYSPTWLYNELAQIIPIPQQVWDRTSASAPVGNYDETTTGAKAVFSFLMKENGDLSTYATNPLWAVVDGPWKLVGYISSTGAATLVRNLAYSGPATGRISRLEIIPYTSDTAEFDDLLGGSGPTYGYVPTQDAPDIARVEASGYRVSPWVSWGITFIPLNFASPTAGPIFRQLYVRQALQELIDQPGYIRAFLHGYGVPTYGPVPVAPASPFLSAAQSRNPYPFSPTGAARLLRAHGWSVHPGGTTTCTRPGTGAGECGKGVAAGAPLEFSMLYESGVTAITSEVQELESQMAGVGIRLALESGSFDTVVGAYAPCSKAGCWQMLYYGQGWYYTPSYAIPTGGALFGSTGASNGGGYDSPTADQLIGSVRSDGTPALHRYEDYLAKDLPVLWMPQLDYQISAIRDDLTGALPQDPTLSIYPENWSFTRG